jgi:mannose-6-phosphate isomerase-like protein (cupin superfamily)
VDGYVLRDAPGWTWKANGRDNEGRFDFLVSELAYGTGPPLHVHTTQEDTFYVLDGVLTVQLGDDIVELGPGDFGTAPRASHIRSPMAGPTAHAGRST